MYRLLIKANMSGFNKRDYISIDEKFKIKQSEIHSDSGIVKEIIITRMNETIRSCRADRVFFPVKLSL